VIAYEVDGDGICTLNWDIPGRSMNVLNRESLAAFEAAVDRALADAAVKGVIVTSGKPDFIAGADLEHLLTLHEAGEIMAMCGGFKDLLRRMETGGKPFVAAMNGTALGGGLELALGCHRRIVADVPKAQIGQPEVFLGLLPGGGGTQRIPRMIGIEAAIPLLVEGTRLNPQQALKAGLIDELVPPGELIAAAKRWLAEDGNAEKPWYDKRYHPPGMAVQSPAGYAYFGPANAKLHAKTRGNYPAPQAILSCVYEGMQVPFEAGLRIESRYFAGLLLRSEARNMIRTLFFNIGDARKLRARPKDVPLATYKRIGILGAGMMGSGITYVSARAGLEVVLLDTTIENAKRGKGYSAGLLERTIQRGRMDKAGRDALLARIHPTTDFTDLAGADLVIEAVFEDRAVKADATKKALAVLGPDAIFASNTSTLPITGLSQASDRPESFIGLHFFSPVDRMQLLEVIRGEKTSDDCLARALDFAKQIGKIPILAGDKRGFYTSRVFGTYIDEGMAMLKDGVKPALIENAGRLAGFPVGPLAVLDEVSIELSYNVRGQQRRDEGEAYVPRISDDVMELMVARLGRKGRKSGGGFYDYPEDGPKRLWPGLADHFPPSDDQPDVEELKKRLLYVQSVDTARCLDERVLTDPRDGDVGSVLGWGFPSHMGGAISLIDTVGADTFVAECDRLAQAHGARFTPPKSLREMATGGSTFHANS
jgi:3-hydroxyacyl-CoA dehydrogenase/enoyl-CoA hydratase/3-hydroxybutyryl-CoA epimerase